MAGPVIKKKVKPYPFKGSIKVGEAGAHLEVMVMKVTQSGIMIEVSGTNVQPGDKLEVFFETPVLHGPVHAAGVVVKLYNQLTGGSSAGLHGAIRLVEIHFRSIGHDSMSHISNFLTETGQVKSR